MSDKVDLKLTLVKGDKEGHFIPIKILIKKKVQQKKITVINLYAPKVGAPNFIKHTLKDLKAYMNSNTVKVGDFNTPLSPIDRSFKQKINKDILELNNTIDQMDLTLVYRLFHLTTAQ
jgi:hypothetical protein